MCKDYSCHLSKRASEIQKTLHIHRVLLGCRGTQLWVHKSCFQHWICVAPGSAALFCPTCGYRYRRGIESSWKVLEVAGKECVRWLALITYFAVSRASARIIYKHLLSGAHDGRPFSFNLFWPAVFLMHTEPQPEWMLLADALISACSVALKRLARSWQWRLPLLFPPPVQIPSSCHEFLMQLLCASTLRLSEILLIIKGHRGSAERLRSFFDLTVNFFAIFYLHRELVRSFKVCVRDSTKVLSFKS